MRHGIIMESGCAVASNVISSRIYLHVSAANTSEGQKARLAMRGLF